MSVTYRTSVAHLEATPLGLLPECWRVVHVCTRCMQRVEGDDLVGHARSHEGEDDNGAQP